MVTSPGSLEQAQALVDEIVRHAREHDNKALLKIDGDPVTYELLAVLPERESRQAEAHLEGARLWRGRQNEKARTKLRAASDALDSLDLTLAKGILRKIDPAVLDHTEFARYDELLLAVEARAVELEDIQRGLPPAPPSDKQSRRKRFWR